MFYGLDVHKAFVQVCELGPEGKRRREFRVGAGVEEIEAFAATLGAEDQVVLEATFHTWAIVRILRPHVSRVVVANPLQVKAIAHARIKTDKVDAHILAQLLRAGFIPEVEMPDEATWELRQLVSHRRHLMKHSVALKNTIHALLNRRLLHYPGSSLFTGPGRSWLAGVVLEPGERFMLDNALRLLDATDASLGAVDAELVKRASIDEKVRLLMTVPGIGVTVAVGLVAAIGDVERFDSPGKLAAYFGLVPRVYQSAGRCYHGRITKTGSSTARHLAIEASQVLAMSSAPIAATYHRVRRKRGHNLAVTALARKLTVVVWHLLSKREPYRYAPPTRTRAKLRTVTKDPERARPGQIPQSLDAIYREAGLPELQAPSQSERRAATRNRRTLTRTKRSRSDDRLTNS
jgi:transposase